MRKLRACRKTVSIVNETPIAIYEKICSDKKGFLLESYDKNNGCYTIICEEPEALIRSEGMSLIIENCNGYIERRNGNPYYLLKELICEYQVEKDAGDLFFTGGLVGSLGYDFIRYTEELPDNDPDEIGIETVQLMLATRFIVIDHVAETMSGVVLAEDDDDGRVQGTLQAERLVEKAITGLRPVVRNYQHDGRIISMTDTLQQYSDKVNKIKAYIREGHIFQTVLSQRWTVETEQNGFELYKELRELNPSPYLYYFNYGDYEVIGSSPEMLVKEIDNNVYTCPIAGTRRRGDSDEEDERLIEELLSDDKEKAEHVMLVDLARNDMGRIAEFGTVKVREFMKVKKYSHVMHIVSLVEGKKNRNLHPMDLAASFLPAGTLSGAPKIRAMEIIDELEEMRRGLYGGATGYIGFNGNMDLCITIRTMIKKGNKVYLQAGAGIVADSDPESEYNECCNKVMALAKTLIKEEEL